MNSYYVTKQSSIEFEIAVLFACFRPLRRADNRYFILLSMLVILTEFQNMQKRKGIKNKIKTSSSWCCIFFFLIGNYNSLFPPRRLMNILEFCRT